MLNMRAQHYTPYLQVLKLTDGQVKKGKQIMEGNKWVINDFIRGISMVN